jgi:hypothetical protein
VESLEPLQGVGLEVVVADPLGGDVPMMAMFV